MNASQIFIVISIAVLVAIAVLFFRVRPSGKETHLSPLACLAFAFILAGLIFGEDRLAGYGLLGVGVILAVIDLVRRVKNLQPTNRE